MSKKKPEVVILDDNPLSIASYAEEYPENWKKINDSLSSAGGEKDGSMELDQHVHKNLKSIRNNHYSSCGRIFKQIKRITSNWKEVTCGQCLKYYYRGKGRKNPMFCAMKRKEGKGL